MSLEQDLMFTEFLPAITQLEKRYESICPTKSIERGNVGREILELVTKAGIDKEYLLHCEQQARGELTERQHDRVNLVIRILGVPHEYSLSGP